MPETEPRLGYSRGVLNQLRTQHEALSKEELLDLVCALTKEYVLDKMIPFDFPLPERADELRADMRADPPDAPEEEPTEDPAERRFARLIDGLKQRTRLPQFEGFSIEDGKAVLVVDNQKIVFGDRVTVRMVSRRKTGRHRQTEEASPPPAAPAAPAPSGPQASRPKAQPTLPRQSAPRAKAQDDDDDDDDDDTGVERFRGLDLG